MKSGLGFCAACLCHSKLGFSRPIEWLIGGIKMSNLFIQLTDLSKQNIGTCIPVDIHQLHTDKS
jgi:hypothetical protein